MFCWFTVYFTSFNLRNLSNVKNRQRYIRRVKSGAPKVTFEMKLKWGTHFMTTDTYRIFMYLLFAVVL